MTTHIGAGQRGHGVGPRRSAGQCVSARQSPVTFASDLCGCADDRFHHAQPNSRTIALATFRSGRYGPVRAAAHDRVRAGHPPHDERADGSAPGSWHVLEVLLEWGAGHGDCVEAL